MECIGGVKIALDSSPDNLFQNRNDVFRGLNEKGIIIEGDIPECIFCCPVFDLIGDADRVPSMKLFRQYRCCAIRTPERAAPCGRYTDIIKLTVKIESRVWEFSVFALNGDWFRATHLNGDRFRATALNG